MDKAEYKIATEHIKKLISQGEYAEASHIADTIDWRRVKSVMMLCTVSDLYKVNRRYEDAKELLYMAYERNPESRTILYSLCDLSIKLEEFVAAIEYYKSFVEVAPRDSGRYVLQYRLYQAQDVGLEERIEVLEQLKKEEYIEKWAYELAYLYHRIGFATKCVEECDELILWFGKGRYVYKAMELKMLHEPLTPSQQYVYDRRFEHLEQAKDMTRVLPRIDSGDTEMTDEGMVDVTDAPTVEIPQEYLEKELHQEVEEIQVKTLDVANAYSTLNLQKELAASLREILEVSHTESSVDTALSEENEASYADTAEMSREFEVHKQEIEAAENDAVGEMAEEDLAEVELPDAVEEEPAVDSSLVDEMAAGADESIVVETITKKTAVMVEPSMAESLQDGMINDQITGQLSIEDVLAEWGKQEEQLVETHQQDISQRIKSQTQDIFAAIEAEMKKDLFEVAAEAEDVSDVQEDEVIDMAQVIESATVQAIAEVVEEVVENEEVEPEVSDAEVAEAEESIEADDVDAVVTEESIESDDEDAVVAEESTEADVAVAEEEKINEDVVEEAADEISTENAEIVEKDAIEDALDEDQHTVSIDLKRYEQFIRSVDTEVQIINVLDNITMDASKGNISVTGHDLGVCFDFIKVLLTDLKRQGFVIPGKTAKISAVNLNKKEPSEIIGKVQSGILIIERAGRLRKNTVEKLMASLQTDVSEVLVFLTDTKQGMNRFVDKNQTVLESFNLRVDIKDYTSDELIEYASKYALENEYSIETMGLLALRTRIEELISNDEALTLEDAQSIVDEAIERVNRKNFKHFMDILLHKRYDEEDMIILREEDFL